MVLECCPDTVFWLVVVGFIIAFVLAFGIGANDVANSFGTSVGSKVLTLKQACILATIFETLGSILIGAQVSGTIRKGIMDPLKFTGSEFELMLGYVSALASCCIWLIVATVLNLPVSGTHSIVGSIIGMALVSRGFAVIEWLKILEIVISWFISPIMSGIVSALIFMLIRRFILKAKSPLDAGIKYLPFIYTITIVVNVGGILQSAPPILKLDLIPWWGRVIIGSVIGILVYLIIWLAVAPYMKKKIEKNLSFVPKQDNLQYNNINNYDCRKLEEGETEMKMLSTKDECMIPLKPQSPDLNEFEKYTKLNGSHLAMKPNVQNKYQIGDNHSTVDARIHKKIISHHDASYTIHGGAISTKNTSRGLISKKNRIRLDSAPTGFSQDDSYDNVNLTLSGYLHNVHSPNFKQHLNQLRGINKASSVNNGLPPVPTSGSLVSPPSGAAPYFNKLFAQPNETAVQTMKNDANLSPIDEKNVIIESKKMGRFVSVPAKDQTVTLLPKNSSSYLPVKIQESIQENDAETDDLPELPSEQEKKPLPEDLYAHSDPPEAAKLFSLLQVLTAIFGSFAHGGNDVSNAIGPLIGLYLIYEEGVIVSKAGTPEWILLYGAVGISAGLWILGRRVIKTIGEDLTKITPSSGFVIEVASAMTVLGASICKIPVSTTHCKVGSVVFTGRVRSKQSVDWSLFRNIIIAWIVTVPVTCSIAAGCQAALTAIFRDKIQQQ